MIIWLAETLVATSLLMAAVMMVRRPLARWLGAGAAYMLWILPLARMLMPALPDQVADASPLHQVMNQSGLPAILVPTAAAQTVETSPAVPWLELVMALWLLGMVSFVFIQAVGYLRFRRMILKGATSVGWEGRLHVVISPHASGPLAFGIVHPHIVLPQDFALRYDPQEQDMAIAHERAHHERGDLVANMIALLLLALHWCNPIAWIAYRAYRADQETACDARVLALYGSDQAHAYGRAILKAAGGRQYAAACHLTRLATLKGRLKMLSSHETSLRRISWGMAAVAVATAAGLALTASGSRAAKQMAAITQKVEQADLTRLTDLVAQPAHATINAAALPAARDMPSPPAAPAAPEGEPVPAVTPLAPIAAVPPAADMTPPIPPVPPTPPVTVRSEKGRIIVTHADGRVVTHRVPTEEEITRMVPVVDVREGCEGKGITSHRETVDANGRRHIRVRICQNAIEAQARQAEHVGKVAARSGLIAARAQLAAARMSAQARAEALREIDDNIAELDGQGN